MRSRPPLDAIQLLLQLRVRILDESLYLRFVRDVRREEHFHFHRHLPDELVRTNASFDRDHAVGDVDGLPTTHDDTGSVPIGSAPPGNIMSHSPRCLRNTCHAPAFTASAELACDFPDHKQSRHSPLFWWTTIGTWLGLFGMPELYLGVVTLVG